MDLHSFTQPRPLKLDQCGPSVHIASAPMVWKSTIAPDPSAFSFMDLRMLQS